MMDRQKEQVVGKGAVRVEGCDDPWALAERYLNVYSDRACSFEEAVMQFGLSLEETESCPRDLRWELDEDVCHHENGDASLWRSWISPACLACRKGEGSETFFISMKCTKDCYFCFNPNQYDYDKYITAKRDIVKELRAAKAAGVRYSCLAITGGEPLLYAKDVLEFIEAARELYPSAHLRLYTNGDLLDTALLGRLGMAGLDEIRFSIKPFEVENNREHLYQVMAKAVALIPAVMVEMPIIPGSFEEMKDILLRIDGLGVKGINLLEFCFPLHNADEFVKRGYKLRKNPYPILYNYWYAGGLPVAGSEAECLRLLEYSHAQGLALGVHYCSLDNKHTSQIYKQNSRFNKLGGTERYPWLSYDEQDFFLKCVRVFGVSESSVAGLVSTIPGLRDSAGEARWIADGRSESLLVPVDCLGPIRSAFPDAVYLLCYNVLDVLSDSGSSTGRSLSDLVVKEIHVEVISND